jgi:hypothetical protein
MPDRSEWVTVFERFPSGRIPIIGPIGLMVHDWSKPVDGHPRLFDHSALELLTTAHPRVVVSVYSLLAVALLWSGVDAWTRGYPRRWWCGGPRRESLSGR